MTDWFVNESHGKKVIHRESCTHKGAARRYGWADDKDDPQQLVVAIIRAGADTWHKGCRHCAADIEHGLIFGEEAMK
jgi:hypothetical protein